MKKIIIIISLVFGILLGALLVLPLVFKQNLIELSKNTINKKINAEVEFAEVKISLFQNFPKATLSLNNVLIAGKNEFKNDTLLNIGLLKGSMSLLSLFKSDHIEIEELIVENPKLNLLVNKDGKANWDINEIKTEKTVNSDANQSVEAKSFNLNLKKIQIRNGKYIYQSEVAKLLIGLTDVNFDISGNMYGESAQLNAEGAARNFTVNYLGIDYFSNVSLSVNTRLQADYNKMKFTVAENELLLNKLALELNGNVDVPSDSMFFDLRLKTKKSDFENFLALVPPTYEAYLKDIKTTGSATVTGSVTGVYKDENYPAFALNLDVSGGEIQYADFPEQIKNITAAVSVEKPQGELNLTEINVKEAHVEIKNNPVDLNLKMNNLVNDPWFDGAFVGKINFDHLKDVLPLDSVNVSGVVDANLFVKGNYSSLEAEVYEQLQTDGIVLLDNFVYDSQNLTKKIIVPKGQLDFSPEVVNLSTFSIRVGQSDFNLSGKISNYLNYFLNKGTLNGNLRLQSDFVNLNELFRLQKPIETIVETNPLEDKETAPSNDDDEEILAFDVPENINLTFRSQVKKAVFDRLPIADINGSIAIKEKKIVLKGLNMKMLEGQLNLNGSYQNTKQNQPFVDFGIDIQRFDIPMAYQTLTGFRRMLPVAGHSKGKFSTNMNVSSQLSPSLLLIPSSINGKGSFSTNDLEINESPIFNQLRGILKPEKLRNVLVEDFMANFIVLDGNLDLRPFKTTVAGQETTFKGTLSAENLINMRLDFNVEREAFGDDIQKILAVIPGNQKIKVVPAGVIIKGPVGNPNVGMDLSETRKYIANATKDDLQDSLNKLGKGLRKLFEK